ncbi:TPA: hypothetical protein MW242_002936 [Acinetobacter baumannii]|nr:hypothetical protein [Acinetobacter baumannii]
MSIENNSSENFLEMLGTGCENLFGVSQSYGKTNSLISRVRSSLENGTLDMGSFNPDKGHVLVIGTTGAGKSNLMPGTPIEPNEEATKAMEEREKEEQRQECIRNQAIKQTYVDHAGDLSFIDDMVHYAKLTPYDTNIPKEKLIQLLFLLDDDVFFKGLRWGFEDTEVREDLYEWIEQNLEPVKSILEQN